MLHQRYAEFAEQLVGPLVGLFSAGRIGADEVPAPRKRTSLRLLAELLLCGVYSDASVLLNVARELVRPCHPPPPLFPSPHHHYR